MIKDILDTQFGRRANHAPARMAIDLVVASGQTTQTATRTIEGAIRGITVGVNNNTGNKTAIVSIVDSDGSILFTGESVAENTTLAPVSQLFMTLSSTDLLMYIPCAGEITIKVTMSGDPGTSTGIVNVKLLLE
jgi:hypothetical protein